MSNRICPALKYCPGCKDQRPIDAFYVVKQQKGYLDALGKRRAARCKQCQSKRYKSLDVRTKLWYAAKQRANRFGYKFTITPDDIVVPECCPVFGTPLREQIGVGRISAMSNYEGPSLDRIDNSKGYTPDNICVISARANCIKGNATPAELIGIAKYVIEKFNLDATGFFTPP